MSSSMTFERLKARLDAHAGDEYIVGALIKHAFENAIPLSPQQEDELRRLGMTAAIARQNAYFGAMSDYAMAPLVTALTYAKALHEPNDQDRRTIAQIEELLLPLIGHIGHVSGRTESENVYHEAKHRAVLQVALRFKQYRAAFFSIRNLLWLVPSDAKVEKTARDLYAQAITSFDRSASHAEGFPEFCEYLADLSRRFGDYKQASELYRFALPGWKDAWWESNRAISNAYLYCETFIRLRLGMTHLLAGEIESAVSELRNVEDAIAQSLQDVEADLYDYLLRRYGVVASSRKKSIEKWQALVPPTALAIDLVLDGSINDALNELKQVEAFFCKHHSLPSHDLERMHTDGKWHRECR